MADLAARLRDVLTPELRERSDFHRPQDWQDVMVSALLPLLSSLLEEREREIREFRESVKWLKLELKNGNAAYVHGHAAGVAEAIAMFDRIVPRLASSSSPAAPQEQK